MDLRPETSTSEAENLTAGDNGPPTTITTVISSDTNVVSSSGPPITTAVISNSQPGSGASNAGSLLDGSSTYGVLRSNPSVPSQFINMSVLNNIDVYSGGPELEAFLDTVACVAECSRWSEQQTISAIKIKLRGTAQKYYYALPSEKRPNTLTSMREWLVQLFVKKVEPCLGERDIEKLFRQKGESLRAFAMRLEIAADKIYPVNGELPLTNTEKFKRQIMISKQFFEGLETRLANEIYKIKEFDDIEEALPVAEKCERVLVRLFKETKADAYKMQVRAITHQLEHTGLDAQIVDNVHNQLPVDLSLGRSTTHPVQNPQDRRQDGGASYPRRGRYPDRSPRTAPQRNNYHYEHGQVAYRSRPTYFNPTDRFPQMRGRCYNCGSMQHISANCGIPKQDFCFKCMKPNHKADSCPLNGQAVSQATRSETA